MSVLTFWRLPEEEAAFLDYLDRTEDLVACVYENVDTPEEVQAAPLRELIAACNPKRVLMAPRPFMDMTPITMHEIDGQNKYGRYYGQGPVICYRRPQWREPGKLRTSNFCYDSQRGVVEAASAPRSSHWVPQPPEFMAWARRVMTWNRRRVETRGYNRATPDAWAAADAGDIELVP